MMSKSAFDAGIPILTEVIVAPRAESASQPAKPSSVISAHERTRIVDAPDVDGWLNEEWNRLEQKIGGRILSQVMKQLEEDIEERVNEALNDVLGAALDTMAVKLKQELQPKLQAAIFEAVRNEVSRMHTSKK